MNLAYLTSQYPASSHTFIRREVDALRALGVAVATFSVRAPSPAEIKGEDDRREAEATYTLLDRSLAEYLAAHLSELARHPLAYLRTFLTALRHRPPGLKAGLLAIAHFGESILLAAELRRRGIDHLHNHFANSGATVGFLASRHSGISWSFTIHGISEFDYPAGLTLARKIAAARFVACVSYFGRAQAARLTDPELWSKLQVIHCGLELDRLPPANRETHDKPRIIVVGRLSAEKGFSGLLDAFSAIQSRPRPLLTIVGDGPLGPALREQAARLGLAEDVRFAGRLTEQETLAEIAASDLLVLSSFMEGLPIVLMEALGLGVPVIAPRVAGIPELVEEGKTGILFAPSDWSELTAAIDRLAGDPALRARLGERGPKRVADGFDVRSSALRLRDLFRQSAGSAASSKELPFVQGRDTSGPSTRRKGAA